MKTFKITLFTICLLSTINALAEEYTFQYPNLSSEERAEDLISRLTLDKKASFTGDNSAAIPRLGVKRFNWWSEALHGYSNNTNVMVFPEAIGMAASFNDDLIYLNRA